MSEPNPSVKKFAKWPLIVLVAFVLFLVGVCELANRSRSNHWRRRAIARLLEGILEQEDRGQNQVESDIDSGMDTATSTDGKFIALVGEVMPTESRRYCVGFAIFDGKTIYEQMTNASVERSWRAGWDEKNRFWLWTQDEGVFYWVQAPEGSWVLHPFDSETSPACPLRNCSE